MFVNRCGSVEFQGGALFESWRVLARMCLRRAGQSQKVELLESET